MNGENRRYRRNGKKSILCDMSKCVVCGSTEGLHTHEVFYGTANRKKSIDDGMVVTLCAKHHNMSSEGVHSDHGLDLALKVRAQIAWENEYGNREMFIERYGKSYL